MHDIESPLLLHESQCSNGSALSTSSPYLLQSSTTSDELPGVSQVSLRGNIRICARNYKIQTLVNVWIRNSLCGTLRKRMPETFKKFAQFCTFASSHTQSFLAQTRFEMWNIDVKRHQETKRFYFCSVLNSMPAGWIIALIRSGIHGRNLLILFEIWSKRLLSAFNRRGFAFISLYSRGEIWSIESQKKTLIFASAFPPFRSRLIVGYIYLKECFILCVFS